LALFVGALEAVSGSLTRLSWNWPLFLRWFFDSAENTLGCRECCGGRASAFYYFLLAALLLLVTSYLKSEYMLLAV